MADVSSPNLPSLPAANSYQTAMRFLRVFILIQGIVAIFLVGVLVYNVQYGVPKDRYFAVSTKGSPRPLAGLPTPYLNLAAIETWTATAVTSVMTFGFNDVDEKFADNRVFFTTDGWRSFNEAMERGGLKKVVIDNQQIITSIVTSTPSIAWAGMRMGKFTWVVQAPIAMTIRAGGKAVTRKINVRLILVRLPTADNPMGIGIDNWIS